MHFSPGYYRVNYDLETWNRLIMKLDEDPTYFDVITRVQLLDDAFNLARAGN